MRTQQQPPHASHESISRCALRRVAKFYALFSSLWIIVSDLLVYRHGGDTPQGFLISLSKGLLFVGVTTALLHAYVSWALRKTLGERDELKRKLHEWGLLANDIILVFDESGRILEANHRALTAYGYTREEFYTLSIAELCAGPERLKAFQAAVLDPKGGRGKSLHRRADGALFPVDFSSMRIESPSGVLIQSILRDISEDEAAQQQILRLKDIYAALSQTNQCITQVASQEALFQTICEIAIRYGRFKLAWVGLVEESSLRVVSAAAAGESLGYLSEIQLSCDPTSPLSHGPTGQAILTGRPVLSRELPSLVFAPWIDAWRRYDFGASAAFPLLRNGRPVGALTLYSAEPDYFTGDLTDLLAEMSRDISSALDRLKAEEERKRLESELRKLMTAIEQGPVTVIITDTDGRIQYVNPAFEAASGFSAQEAIGLPPERFLSSQTAPEEHLERMRQLKNGDSWAGLLHSRRKDGTLYWEEVVIAPVRDANGEIEQYISIQQDITSRLKAEENARFLTFHDPLTRLPNRMAGKIQMEAAIAGAHLSGAKAALLYLDIDNFKRVNDSLGHEIGDRLLQALSERMRESLPADCALNRLAGDEFLIVVPWVESAEKLLLLAEELRRHCAAPFEIDGFELIATLSIGLALYPDDGDNFSELHRRADLAMYQAKKAGRNSCRLYAQSMDTEAHEYLLILNGLRKAIDRQEFLLHYQPQIDLPSGRVSGAEALIRWRHPELGMIPPGRFISVAEDSGLIVEIGDWVIREACRQAQRWREAGLPPLSIAVNVSALQFQRGQLVETVRSALAASGLEPGRLELELTESILAEDQSEVAEIFQRLHEIGVKLAIDDFGSGYSSFAYLGRLPLDRLKIDQSFVRHVDSNKNDAMIVASIVNLAKDFHLETIAEGVETSEALDLVQRAGCDSVQGYFFARPMPAEDFSRFLTEKSRAQ